MGFSVRYFHAELHAFGPGTIVIASRTIKLGKFLKLPTRHSLTIGEFIIHQVSVIFIGNFALDDTSMRFGTHSEDNKRKFFGYTGALHISITTKMVAVFKMATIQKCFTDISG